MKSGTPVILIAIAVGLFYTFIDSEYQKVKVLRAQAEEYETVLDNVERILETRDRLIEKYQSLPPEEVEKLSKVLPDHVDTVRLALDLDTIAGRYGISIKNIQVNTERGNSSTASIETSSGAPYDKVEVSFSFVANYANFRRFIADIEKSLRITDTRAISFTTGEGSLYEYDVTVETYWLK